MKFTLYIKHTIEFCYYVALLLIRTLKANVVRSDIMHILLIRKLKTTIFTN